MRLAYLYSAFCLAVGMATPGWADDTPAPVVGPANPTQPVPAPTICQTIDAAATAQGLPDVFFTRLIWDESRLEPNAVSPVGAEGIAQFMPATAALRGLADAFDPAQAIPASAAYLSDLAARFGNLGLAAAAYNAGEQRVSDWLSDAADLPAETDNYVFFITGYTADAWKKGDPTLPPAGASPAPAVAPMIGADASQPTLPATPVALVSTVSGTPAAAEAVPAPTLSPDCATITALLSQPGAGSATATPAAPSAQWAPWGVQLAGNFSEARARAGFAQMQKQYASILGGRDPLVVRSVMRSRGTAPFYAMVVPAASRDEANALCTKLQAAGGACVIRKN